MKFFKKFKNQYISKVVILAVIFGFAAGIVGQIVSKVYIDPLIDSSIEGALNTNQNISTSIPELRRIKKFLGVQQDFRVDEITEKFTPSLAGVYLKKPETTKTIGQIYLTSDFRGNAFILTSDGWLVTHQSVISKLDRRQLVVISNQKIFPVEEIITDPLTNIAFLKIAADNLPVVVLGDFQENISGQLVLVLNALGEVTVTSIKDIDYRPKTVASDFIRSSENFFESILIKDELNQFYLGAPLFNLAGEVIGVVENANSTKIVATAVPVNHFRPIIINVLRDNKIKRPYLGINYLDLSESLGIKKEVSQGLNKGALVYGNPERLGPAAEAGIEDGDIIVKIDNQEIDQQNSLTKIIQEYQIGDGLNLTILREGKEIIKEVYLGAIE